MRYDVITRESHPHNLKHEDSKYLFRCDGCEQDGIGSCYRCDWCNFDLHYHCATASKTISHPLYPERSFKFMRKPPKVKPPAGKPPKGRPPKCNACGKDVTGFCYCCEVDGVNVNLHPCCAKLPRKLDDGKMKFYLYTSVSTTSCFKCEKKRRSWVYRSNCSKKYTVHVACAREMLVEMWSNGDSGTRRGASTRVLCLKDRLQVPHKMSKSKKKWKILRLALQFLISAVVGDPTTLIAGVFGSLMS